MRIATTGLKGLSTLLLLAATCVAVADEPVDVSSADVEKMGDEEENYLVSGLYRIP